MANGLINLQTDLKSLRYGSSAPYVTKDINKAPSSDKIGLQASRRIDDTSRIVQMLASKPGLKYLANEALLQQINAEDKMSKAVKNGKSVAGAILQQIGGTFVGTVKIVGSTLAQVPINGTGTHFLKGFKTNTYLQPNGADPVSKFAAFFGAGGVEGAPYALRGEIVPGTIKGSENFGEISEDGKTFKATTPSKYDYDGATTIKYIGKAYEPTDEKVNEAIPKKSEARETKINAQNGTAIPVGSTKPTRFGKDTTTDFRDLSPTKTRGVETTPTPGTPTYQSSIKSISNRVDSDSGYASPDSINNIPSASNSYDNPYTKREAKTSISSAQTGAPIPVYPSNSSLKDTTLPTSGIGYGDAAWLQGEQDNLSDSIQRYNQYGTYTERTTEDNIRNTLSGSPIKVARSGSQQNDTTAQLGELHDPTTADPIEISTAFKLKTEWYNGDTYTGTTTEDNIGAVKGDSPISVVPSESGIYESTKTVPGDNLYGEDITYVDSKPLAVIKSRRVRLGNQGHAGIPGTDFYEAKKANYYWVTDKNRTGVDVLNALEPSTSRQDELGTDFAKFYFQIITPDNPTGTFLHFRAFIDSIDDSYSADWAGRQYNGRAEKFYTYGGFDRDISVSFNVAAASREELMPMYRKMVYLASVTAPTYGKGSGLMRGTLARLTIGSYFSHIPGVITSVKYSLDENAPWEIQLGKGTGRIDTDVQTLPMMLKCSVSFKPIHDFAPQTGLYPYFTEMKEPKEDKAVVKTKKKKEVEPTPPPKKDKATPPKVVPVRVQESTGTAQNSKIKTDSERAMKANKLVPKKTLEQIGIDYKKDLEESKKKKLQIVKY